MALVVGFVEFDAGGKGIGEGVAADIELEIRVGVHILIHFNVCSFISFQ
jgi:hypothetical protein